jgi:hypothetical protein
MVVNHGLLSTLSAADAPTFQNSHELLAMLSKALLSRKII